MKIKQCKGTTKAGNRCRVHVNLNEQGFCKNHFKQQTNHPEDFEPALQQRGIVCEQCGDWIHEPEQGWVEWFTHKGKVCHMRFVHHFPHSPLREHGGCAYREKDKDPLVLYDATMKDFLGPFGKAADFFDSKKDGYSFQSPEIATKIAAKLIRLQWAFGYST